MKIEIGLENLIIVVLKSCFYIVVFKSCLIIVAGSGDEDEEMTKQDNVAIERAEEQKLRAKYAQVSSSYFPKTGRLEHSVF